MIRRTRKCKSDLHQPSGLLWAVTILTFIIINVTQAFAQDTILADFAISVPESTDVTRNFFGGKITNSGYGGPAIKFSRFNNQFAFMTGGRGAITVNNRYIIGGGGYGISNRIYIPDLSADTSRLFKMGYGGVELGYIFLPGKKMNIGGSLLIAAGATFWQNKPKSRGEKLFDDDFNIFPVLEPSLYCDYDYTCSYTEAKSYFEKLKAPIRGFYTFEQSAHSPLFEEPEKMKQILKVDVLAGLNNLSDIK